MIPQHKVRLISTVLILLIIDVFQGNMQYSAGWKKLICQVVSMLSEPATMLRLVKNTADVAEGVQEEREKWYLPGLNYYAEIRLTCWFSSGNARNQEGLHEEP